MHCASSPSPEQWQLHQDARIKTDFYLRRLKYLKQQLQQLNIPLIILNIPLWENLAPEILNLCQTLKIESLHANIEVGVNELERDAQVQQLLQQQQIRVEFYHDRILFPLAVSGISLIKPIRSIVPLRKML